MKLRLTREFFMADCTLGRLFVDDEFECYTLEPVVRDVKIDGCTAIPKGFYKILINFSNHFKTELPLILNVPGFQGVRIHPGNTDKDTEGCILVGKTRGEGDFIGQSRVAFEALFTKMKAASEITLEIV